MGLRPDPRERKPAPSLPDCPSTSPAEPVLMQAEGAEYRHPGSILPGWGAPLFALFAKGGLGLQSSYEAIGSQGVVSGPALPPSNHACRSFASQVFLSEYGACLVIC